MYLICSSSYCFRSRKFLIRKLRAPCTRNTYFTDLSVPQVARKMAKEFNPSAFQIRFAGFKGVLAVDPRLPGKTAHLRPSMRKFQSPHRRLEVLQTSRAQDVYLNHQVIMLLSNLGVPDKVFMELQRRMMDNLAGEILL